MPYPICQCHANMFVQDIPIEYMYMTSWLNRKPLSALTATCKEALHKAILRTVLAQKHLDLREGGEELVEGGLYQ